MTRRSINPNLIFNGNFEIAPPFTAATTTAATWVNGLAAGSAAFKECGWGIPSGSIAASAAVQFDTAEKYSGDYSLKLSTLNSSGAITVANYRALDNLVLPPILPSTAYTLTARVKTNNAAAAGAFIDFRQINSSLGTISTTSSTKLAGTNDWTQLSVALTSSASAAFAVVFLRLNVTGNVSDAWFDEVTLSTTVSPTRTAV